MAAAIKYVRPRNGVYQYERRVPLWIARDPDLLQRCFGGSKLFRRTLGTRDQGKMLRAAGAMHEEFERRVARAPDRSPRAAVAEVSKVLQQVTPEVLSEITDQQRFLVLRPWINAYLHADQSPEHAEELERMKSDRELFAAEAKAMLQRPGARSDDGGGQSPIEIAEGLIDGLGLDAPANSRQRSYIALAVRAGRLKGEEEVDLLLQGRLPATSPPTTKPAASAGGGFTLRDAVAAYVHEVSLRPKTINDVRVSLELFERAVGNKRLTDLRRTDFQVYIGHLASKQVGGRSVGSVQRMISPATVQKRLTFLRSAINHAIEKGLHEGGNPASNFDISKWVKAQDKAVMPAKRPFKVTELNLLFQHPWFTGCESPTRIHTRGKHRLAGAHYWAPIVALFTGCRTSELGGLMLSEIELRGPHPHLHIRDNRYRPTKGGYSRFVPLLDALLEVGFAEYVASVSAVGEDRLFPDWKAPSRSGDFDKDDAAWSNAGMIRSFNRTVITHTLADRLPEGARREVTFHSFRGSFKSMLGLSRHQVAPNVINEVIGHSKSELDKRYVGVVPLDETYSAIHRCSWTDLKIPPAP